MRRLTAPLFVLSLLLAWSAGCNASGISAAPAAVSATLRPTTLLDEVGRLYRPVAVSEAAQWRKDLSGKPADTSKLDQERIWLGEYLLAHDEQPEQATAMFSIVSQSPAASKPAAGLAVYDSAMADFYRGAYRDAADDFSALLNDKTGLTNFPLRNCALWYRHALACANFHSDNARKGVPEPPSLDPLCGAAAIASSLKSLSLPFAERYVVDAVRPSGEGNSFAQLIDSGARLHVNIRPVHADEAGLKALPKPVIAYVELDHFVSVTSADASGVTYLCSDCGAWPGGAVHLSWSQWRGLDPGAYGVVTVPGTRWDKIMELALAKPAPNSKGAGGVQLASLKLPIGMRSLLHDIDLVNLIKAHVVAQWNVTDAGCGTKPNALHCPPAVHCPTYCVPGTQGDPVDLATGEEEYAPGPDMSVYNPLGPSVTWGRIYNSLRGFDDNNGDGGTFDYECDDFGVGWSNNYNYEIIDPNNG